MNATEKESQEILSKLFGGKTEIPSFLRKQAY